MTAPVGAADVAGWTAFQSRARALDAADPLAACRAEFVTPPPEVLTSYLDGNSLGRPLRATRERLLRFVDEQWGGRLIRGWDEGWLDQPFRVGDELGRIVLGAAPGQTLVGDSTTVLLYKWIRAAVDAQPGRAELVVDTGNFPTDRFLLEGVAAERGLRVRRFETDAAAGATVEAVREVVGPDTALVLLSHVAFHSAHLADAGAITEVVHRAGGLMLWDLSHSVGAVPIRLDEWGVDLAVGCSYKYLNGGPGAPAFGYVRRALHDRLRQPIWGWLGAAEPFAMADHYQPAAGIRGFGSGTPPITAMLALQDMLALIDRVGLASVRMKSVALTEYVTAAADKLLRPLGVGLASPRDPAQRGSHVTLTHPRAQQVTARLWRRGVVPDFRPPDGIRIGLSPLSTGFTEVYLGLAALAEELHRPPA